MKTQTSVNPPANIERRRSQRKQFRGKIEIEWGSATLTGTVRDVARQGLFIELTPPLWVGATFVAKIAMGPVVLLDCTVRRVEPGKGMAVTFEIAEESGKAQIEALLASLPQV